MEDVIMKNGMDMDMGEPQEAQGSAAGDGDEEGAYVKFSRPYVFEDETFEGIDVSCLEGLSARDIMEVEKRFYKLGIATVNPETTLAYAKIVLQKASGLPIEFFDDLPAKDMMQIKRKVVNFFYG